MPPLTRNNGDRQLQVMIANPARTARAMATSQSGALSGQIPGTSSDPTQPAIQYATIQQYPTNSDGPTPSPNGDQVAGVGHVVLNNAGNPVVVMGNLSATQTGGVDLPADFQDGGFAFVDADGNLPAGYSQSTGLWGFGGSAPPTVYTAGAIIGPLFLNVFGFGPRGAVVNCPQDAMVLDSVVVDANTTFEVIDGLHAGNSYAGVSSERSWTYASVGVAGQGAGLIPADSEVPFALASIGPTPTLVSVTVDATTLDGSQRIAGHWDSNMSGTATWVSTATTPNWAMNHESPPAGNEEIVAMPVVNILNLDVALSAMASTGIGSAMSFATGFPPGALTADNNSGYIQVATELTSPLLVHLRTSAYWLA